jgi:hypothetical protein
MTVTYALSATHKAAKTLFKYYEAVVPKFEMIETNFMYTMNIKFEKFSVNLSFDGIENVQRVVISYPEFADKETSVIDVSKLDPTAFSLKIIDEIEPLFWLSSNEYELL